MSAQLDMAISSTIPPRDRFTGSAIQLVMASRNLQKVKTSSDKPIS